MLERAKEALRAGQTALARRQLELIVARSSRGPVAHEARRLLRLVYLAEPPPTAGLAPEAVQPAAIPPHMPLAPPGGAAGPASGDAWRAIVRPMRPAGTSLADTVGDRVFFGEGGADLGLHARHILAVQARWIAAHPDLQVTVEGFADDHGTLEHNLALARRRAEAVRQRLIEEGLAHDRITARAGGSDARLVLCAEPDCRHLNRLAVTRVVAAARTSAGVPHADVPPGGGTVASPARARR